MKKNVFNIILSLCWFFLVIFTAFHHELWRDEAQVWCIVRDCNLPEIINMARIEGHPLLWYLILLPFAKLGLNVAAMQIISIISVGIGILWLIFKSEFSYIQKILIISSAGLLYYLPVVARNYSLIVPVLFFIAAYWKEKDKHPIFYPFLIILLSQTHSYMLGLVCILTLFFIINEFKKHKIACFVLVLNLIFVFFYFKGALSENYALATKYKQVIPPLELTVFLSQVWLFDIINNIKSLIKFAIPISIMMFFPFIISYLIGLYKSDRKVFVVAMTSVLFILVAFSRVYFNGILYQKLFLIVLVLIFSRIMIADKTNKLVSYSLNILLITSCLTSFFVVNQEIKYNFSGSKQTAEYINENYRDEETFIALGNPYLYSSLSAYLPNKKIYSPLVNNYISYFTFYAQDAIKGMPFPEQTRVFVMDEKENVLENDLNVVFASDNKNISSRTEREVFRIGIKNE